MDAADESVPIFGNMRLITDARVNAGLRRCLACNGELHITATEDNDPTAWLFAHCRACNRLYVLDSMTFPK